MSGWHVDAAVAAAYGDRRLGAVGRASVEAHAGRCDPCRDALAEAVVEGLAGGPLDLDRLWSRVEAEVVVPDGGVVPRWLGRLGMSSADLVVLRAVAAQSRQWTIATSLVLLAAAVAAVLGPIGSAHAAFLVVAPLLPALGVAATYRLTTAGVDQLERVAPYAPARLLLWRTAYVVATAVPVAAVLGALVLRHPWAATSWLLPGLACTLWVAAATTWTDPLRPALVVGAAWAALVVLWDARDTPWAVATAPTQLGALVVALAAAAVLQHRLDADPTPALRRR